MIAVSSPISNFNPTSPDLQEHHQQSLLTFLLSQNISPARIVTVRRHARVGDLTRGGRHMTGGGAAGAAAKVVMVTRGVAAGALAGLRGGGGGGDAHVDAQPALCGRCRVIAVGQG